MTAEEAADFLIQIGIDHLAGSWLRSLATRREDVTRQEFAGPSTSAVCRLRSSGRVQDSKAR